MIKVLEDLINFLDNSIKNLKTLRNCLHVEDGKLTVMVRDGKIFKQPTDEYSHETVYIQDNIDFEVFKKYYTLIFISIRILKGKLIEINKKVEENKTLEIDFQYFTRYLYNKLDNHIHRGSVVRTALFSVGNNKTTVFRDEITHTILNMLEKIDTHLSDNMKIFLENTAKYRIEIIKLNYNNASVSLKEELINPIKNNLVLRLIKISAGFFQNADILEQEEFINAIHSSKNLFGIEINEQFRFNFDNILDNLKKVGKQRPFYLRCFDSAHKDVFILNRIDFFDMRDTKLVPLLEAKDISEIFNLAESGTKLPYLINNPEFLLSGLMEDNWYPIDYAVWKNDLLSFLYIFQFYPHLLFQNKVVNTLHLAVQHADPSIVKFLLEQVGVKEKAEYIESLEDETGNSPLCLAAKYNKRDNLKILLQYNAKINHENFSKNTALGLAFQGGHYEIVKMLLNHGAEIPTFLRGDFINILQANTEDLKGETELKTLLDFRRDLHDTIQNDDLQKLRSCLELVRNAEISINNCLDLHNHTLLYNAVVGRKYAIYGYLMSSGANFSEKEGVSALVVDVGKEELRNFEDAALPYLPRSEDALAKYLYSVTRIRGARQNLNIEDLYLRLLNDSNIRPILEIIEYAEPRLDIVVDMNAKHVSYISPPMSSEKTMGACDYSKSRIYIGTNDSLEEMMGSIAHEFTHQACEILFKNKTTPYPSDNGIKKAQFSLIKQQVKKKIDDGEDMDDIIKRVFTAYADPNLSLESQEALDNSELIVRVPHMLAKYGCSQGMRRLEVQVPSLLNFYLTEFLPLCRKFVKDKQQTISVSPYQLAMKAADRKKPRDYVKSLKFIAGEISKIGQSEAVKVGVGFCAGAAMAYFWCHYNSNGKNVMRSGLGIELKRACLPVIR